MAIRYLHRHSQHWSERNLSPVFLVANSKVICTLESIYNWIYEVFQGVKKLLFPSTPSLCRFFLLFQMFKFSSAREHLEPRIKCPGPFTLLHNIYQAKLEEFQSCQRPGKHIYVSLVLSCEFCVTRVNSSWYIRWRTNYCNFLQRSELFLLFFLF